MNEDKPIDIEVSKVGPNPFQKVDRSVSQKPIRTYESDLAEALKGNTSVASIAIAESKRKDQEKRTQEYSATVMPDIPPTPTKAYIKKAFVALISLIFIGGGLVGGYYLYEKSAFAPPATVPQKISVPNLIPSDKQVSIRIDGRTGNDLITNIYSEINKNTLPGVGILELMFFEKSGMSDEGEIISRVSGPSFVGKVKINMPDVILRSMTDRWMFGAYTEENGSKTSFVALTTDFFQNAFAGMLKWENAMPDDLATLLNFKEKGYREELNASSTVSAYFSIQGDWSDKVLRNRDVREYRNKDGELLFLYSFINKETLIITTTESSFIAIVDRIEKDNYVR